MKKFYAIAALLCGSFMAASAVTVAPKAEVKGGINVSKLSVKNITDDQLKVVDVQKNTENRLQRAPRRVEAKAAALTMDEIVGEHADWGNVKGSSEFYGTFSFSTLTAVSDTEVELAGYVTGNENIVLKGTFNAEDSTITIPWNQPFKYQFSDGEGECLLYALDTENMAPKDIVLKYNDEILGFSPVIDIIQTDKGGMYTNLIIFGPNNGSYGSYYLVVYESYSCKFNSTMAWSEIEEPTNSDFNYRVIYTELAPDNYLRVYNLYDLGFLFPIELYVDEAAACLICNQQVVVDFNKIFAGAQKAQDLIGVLEGNEGDDFELSAQVQSDDQGSYTMVYKDLIGIEFPNLNNTVDVFYHTQFMYDGDIFAHVGVKDVDVDNSNAPVEYFNLQGVRIANPENGLFIRRQGSDVKKVIVK